MKEDKDELRSMEPEEFITWLKGFLDNKTTLSVVDMRMLKGNIEKTVKPVVPFFPGFPSIDNEKDALQSKCSKCGLAFTDPMGRPIPLGYVCNNPDCPSGLGPTMV